MRFVCVVAIIDEFGVNFMILMNSIKNPVNRNAKSNFSLKFKLLTLKLYLMHK